MLWQAKYPYTVNLETYARREVDYYGTLEELLSDEEAINLGLKRLENVLSGEDLRDRIGSSAWEEVLSFHTAVAIVAQARSLRLLHRLSQAEAKRARNLLRDEDTRGLLRLARSLGIDAENEQVSINWIYSKKKGVIPKILQYSVSLAHYLRTASRLEGSKWRLSNSFILSGRVFLDKEVFEELLTARVEERIVELAGYYADLNLPKLREIGLKMATRLDQLPYGKFDPSKLPACIREIVESIRKGELIPEPLYMIATFLANVNAPPEYLGEILYSSGKISHALASIMAEALLSEAKGFRPYRCEVALEKGLCSECKGNVISEYWKAMRRGQDSS